MSLIHTITTNWTNDGNGRTIRASVTRTNNAEDSLDLTVPGPSNPLHIVWALKLAQLKSLYMLSDLDLTIKTNSNSAPDATVALKAGVPLAWDSVAAYFSNPFGSVNITDLYITLAGSTAANLHIEVLKDSTA